MTMAPINFVTDCFDCYNCVNQFSTPDDQTIRQLLSLGYLR
jgi:hypothetical protein